MLGLSEVKEEWSYERILNYYNVQADNTPDTEALDLVDEVLLRVAQIKKQDKVRETFILSKIVEKIGSTNQSR